MFRSVRWYTRELERRERAWAAERAELVATVCRLAGKPAPVTLPHRTVAEPPLASESWTPSPEQLPVT